MKTFAFTLKSSRTIKAAVGRNLTNIPGKFPALFSGADKVCLITGEGSPQSLMARAGTLFPNRGGGPCIFKLPRSEKAKTLEQAARLCSFLFAKGFSRNSLLIAVGGGAVTDLAGFAASIYMRGINWVSVPTTFLAQIDAGLGGKTAVNLGGAKNILGTFHQPALAVCDTAFLDSLPCGELRSGAGELIKYAIIAPGKLRRSLERLLPQVLAGDGAALTACVCACAGYKLKLVAADERDATGARERLNLGHTAGHALEALAGGRMQHGTAVARGLRFALLLSTLTGRLAPSSFGKFDALITALRLPPPPPMRGHFREFLALIPKDKKARGVKNRFLLVLAPGRIEAVENIEPGLLKKAYYGAII